MFQRREPLSILQKIREIFWPSMGWRRAFHYTRHRIIRLSDTTHKIAAGLAIGAAVSFTPLVGTHFIQAGFFAYLTRANVIAALIGTFVGNPWTFPFMWWAAISFGSSLFSLFSLPASTNLPDHMDFAMLWEIATTQPLRLFLPWLLGGYLLAVLSWIPAYFVFYQMVHGAKLARIKARMRKVHKVAREVTGQES